MGCDRMQMLGAALTLDGLTDDRVAELDRLWPGWCGELREMLEQLTCCDDLELRMLAEEALTEFEGWMARR